MVTTRGGRVNPVGNVFLSAVAVCAWGVCLCLLEVAQAWAHPFTIDQGNDAGTPFGGFVIPQGAPVGQEFVPTLAQLDVVELQMNAQNPNGGNAVVRIRSGSIAGPILGVSEPVFIPAIVFPLTLAHFDFSTPVPLVPGTIHVMEVVAIGNSLGVWGDAGIADYLNGAAIVFGVLQPLIDLWFREGIAKPIGVEAPTWGGIKGLYR